MATHKLTYKIEGSGIIDTQTIENTVTGVALIDNETVADGQTDFEINLDLDVSACKVFYLKSSQAVTFETNSGSSPADTISLRANEPYIWRVNDYNSFLLGTDVNLAFITNASGSSATILCVAGFDATP